MLIFDGMLLACNMLVQQHIFQHIYTHTHLCMQNFLHHHGCGVMDPDAQKAQDTCTRSSTKEECRGGTGKGTIFTPCKVSPRIICLWWLVSQPGTKAINDG